MAQLMLCLLVLARSAVKTDAINAGVTADAAGLSQVFMFKEGSATANRNIDSMESPVIGQSPPSQATFLKA